LSEGLNKKEDVCEVDSREQKKTTEDRYNHWTSKVENVVGLKRLKRNGGGGKKSSGYKKKKDE